MEYALLEMRAFEVVELETIVSSLTQLIAPGIWKADLIATGHLIDYSKRSFIVVRA